MIADAVRQGVAPFGARLSAIEDELERTGRMVDGVMGHLNLRAEQQPEEGDEAPRVPAQDAIWACKKCSTRLGMYDPENDVLRIRHKEYIAHVHSGVGGWVRVVCKGCAELNVVEYAPAVAEVEGAQQLQVVGDQLVVDEPLLMALLEHVRERGGQAVVRLVQAPQPDTR